MTLTTEPKLRVAIIGDHPDSRHSKRVRASDHLGEGRLMRLYHMSGSRSTRVLWMLEEIGVRYEVTLLTRQERKTLGTSAATRSRVSRWSSSTTAASCSTPRRSASNWPTCIPRLG
jgi:hypothetical protein